MGRGIMIDGSREAAALFAPAMRGLDHEEIWAALLGADHNLIRFGCIASGAPGHVEMPLRPVFRQALRSNAAALIVAHNHPSGDPAPSRADLLVTRQMVSIARLLGVAVLDHLIFADDAVTSLRALGML